ncbi:PaaI family thioesterase [Emcibacter sp. SYSU 3D8]|uniref:PaaI family thioesterase n=1 Tax=Emcibacter sp. SYSU 3D8 TaxID=3133969 RepID=UPI0031FE4528
MTDDDRFQRMIQSQKFLDRIPHMHALGLELVEFAPGKVTVRLPYNRALIGNPDTGVLAGGAISATLDNVCGSAVVARTAKPAAFATLDLRIDYMRPAEPDRDVLAFAECYRVTRQIAFVRGFAYQDDPAKPIANATATFMFTGRGELAQAKDA